MKVQINIMVLPESVIKLAKHFYVFLTVADQATIAMTTQFAHQNVQHWRFVCFN